MRLQFKKALSDIELKEVELLAKEIWQDHFTPIIGQQQVDYMLEKYNSIAGLKYHIDEMGYEVQRIYFKDQICGYLAFSFQEDERLFLSKFYLHKSIRGKGLGKEAFDYLKERCHENGMKFIKLTVNKYNDLAIDVYKQLGFQTVDSVVTDIGNGFVMDDYVMEYKLI